MGRLQIMDLFYIFAKLLVILKSRVGYSTIVILAI